MDEQSPQANQTPNSNSDQEPVHHDDEWPWPQYPRLAKRNTLRYYGEPFTGWEGDFLDEYRRSGVLGQSAKNARVSLVTVQRRRKRDPEFMQACEEALDIAIDAMESAALQRAVNGTTRKKGVYFKGKQIGDESYQDYSDTLLIFMLKALRPDKYREQVDHNHRIQAMRDEAQRIAEQTGLNADEVLKDALDILGVKHNK